MMSRRSLKVFHEALIAQQINNLKQWIWAVMLASTIPHYIHNMHTSVQSVTYGMYNKNIITVVHLSPSHVECCNATESFTLSQKGQYCIKLLYTYD